MRVRNLVLTVVAAAAVATVGGCGAPPEEPTMDSNTETVLEGEAGDPNEIKVISVNIDGEEVKCVIGVTGTGKPVAIDCDFPVEETTP